MAPTPFRRLLVANRGEIAIRILRACNELAIESVALYTHEDRYSLHRYKADEAYCIGPAHEPLKPYLDIEAIVALAREKRVDAIHPGYGFLSENAAFAEACVAAGIAFVGPRAEVLASLGDKIAAKELAVAAGLPVVPTNQLPLDGLETALAEGERMGYPVLIKAAAGGGGRGMRVVRQAQEMAAAWSGARDEARAAFGNDQLFLEKYLSAPRHIEVQLLGDGCGNLVHLFERDCSVQRRFQKLVEVAPGSRLAPHLRERMHEDALRLGRSVKLDNAATVEFLVAGDQAYFIEVNPRIQVEHTVTEQVTGIDLVRSQILIAQGHSLADPCIFLRSQEDVRCTGYAIQCRITTEDPAADFRPDHGTIIAYRHAGGMGIRIDEGSTYPGMKISPFFDSLLVKVTASGRTLQGASQRLERALREFRVRGVKNNALFLINVLRHPDFLAGNTDVSFIATHPELFVLPPRRDRATKLLRFLAHVTLNGHGDFARPAAIPAFRPIRLPKPASGRSEASAGTRQRLAELGPDGFSRWLREEKWVHFTDTTFRDAHQSLLATRLRTQDMLGIAADYARLAPHLFSLEVWGGATFDVAMRFLRECPWQRLRLLRQAVPNILLQMLLRASNAVGYTAYPDNLVEAFIEESWRSGIDLFRVFDCFNDLDNLRFSIAAVRRCTPALAEGAICYTGDMRRPHPNRYHLQYYLDLARHIEDAGAHLLAIKDMAGLLKPYAAEELVSTLRQHLQIPIHLHTHDSSGIQAATLLKAIEAGVDVVDAACASMSGLTSQPNLNSLISMLSGAGPQRTACPGLEPGALNALSNYWEDVRCRYFPFESGLMAGSAEIYEHEIPGGQYSNLRPQARALGLEDHFDLIKSHYRAVNLLFGDLIKVTPSSKVVGDMAFFLAASGASAEDFPTLGASWSLPQSVRQFFRGELGTPPGGFPAELQALVLAGEQPLTGRPGATLAQIDLPESYRQFQERFPAMADWASFLSWQLYPAVFEAFYQHAEQFGQVWRIPTESFFYGMRPGEEISLEMDAGKVILVRLVHIEPADAQGMARVHFELNGQSRRLSMRDHSVQPMRKGHLKAGGEGEIAAPLPGRLSRLLVAVGDGVRPGMNLFLVESMKMETAVQAELHGRVAEIVLPLGSSLEQGDLVLRVQK